MRAVEMDWDALKATLFKELNDHLHELSQPVTVLLCATEYGAGLDSLTEMRETMVICQEASERVRDAVISMQARVRESIEARAT